jgi:hypothetical protein
MNIAGCGCLVDIDIRLQRLTPRSLAFVNHKVKSGILAENRKAGLMGHDCEVKYYG